MSESGGVTVRSLLVTLGFDVDEASMAKAVAAGNLVAKGLELAVKWADNLVTSFKENVKGAIEYGDKLNKTSQSLGIATDALQELQYAASLGDISAEEMSASIGKLSGTLLAAKNGSEEAKKALRGIDFQKDGRLLSADEVLTSVAEKFKAMPDGVEKTALSMQLFGRSGKQLIPLLNEGAEGLGKLRQEARDLGLVMDGEAIKASAELSDNFGRLHAVSKGLWRQAIAPLLPAINELVKRILEWRKANAQILAQKLRAFMGALIAGVKVLIEVFRSIVRIASAVTTIIRHFIDGIMFLVRILSKGAPEILILAAAFALLSAPVTLVVAGLTALYLILDDVIGFMQGKDSLLGRWIEKLNEWLKPAKGDTWFVTALKEFIRLMKEGLDELPHLSNDIKQFFFEIGNAIKGYDAARRLIAAISSGDIQGIASARADLVAASAASGPALAGGSEYKPGVSPSWKAPIPMGLDPTFRAPMSYGGRSSVTAPVSINVQTQPGQSNEAIAEMVAQRVADHWDTKMEEAEAGVR